MSNHINAKDVKEQVSIINLLSGKGYAPVRKTGGQYYYHSMLRDDDETPSLVVKDETGQWYEHGLGVGGNVIDLGLRLWKDLSFPEVLQKIVDTSGVARSPNYTGPPKRPLEKKAHYDILEIKDLGQNVLLMNYLESRGIALTAEGILKELYYYVENEQSQRKNFFAAGWQNENGGWEIRNANFKGSLGPKAISFIPGDPHNLVVFEGMMDYLSWKSTEPFCEDSILIMNSVGMIVPALDKAKRFANIATYFDNDSPGRAATTAFKDALPQSVDHSWIYEGYKDYNDKLQAELRLNNQGYSWET